MQPEDFSLRPLTLSFPGAHYLYSTFAAHSIFDTSSSKAQNFPRRNFSDADVCKK
jgi:hypothetical protein